MLCLVAGVATEYLGCSRLFEAAHVLDEAIAIARSLTRRDPASLEDDHALLENLQQRQMQCLKQLGRASEGYRILARSPKMAEQTNA